MPPRRTQGRLTRCPLFRWHPSSGLGQGTGCGADTQQGTRGSWLWPVPPPRPPCARLSLQQREPQGVGRRGMCRLQCGQAGARPGAPETPTCGCFHSAPRLPLGRRRSPNLLPPVSLGAWPSPCELEARPSLTAMDWRLSGRWRGQGLHPHRWEEATRGCPRLRLALERGARGRGAGGSSGGLFRQRGISCWIAGLAVPKNKASPRRQRGAQMAGAWGPGARPSQDAGACALQRAVHSHPSRRALRCRA